MELPSGQAASGAGGRVVDAGLGEDTDQPVAVPARQAQGKGRATGRSEPVTRVTRPARSCRVSGADGTLIESGPEKNEFTAKGAAAAAVSAAPVDA